MADMRAQVILKTVDNVAENYVTNSWAFKGEDTEESTTAITTALKNFYSNIVSYLSPSIAQNGHAVKYYTLPGTKPNYPFDEDSFNLASAPAGTALPSEIAVCLSFQGTRAAGFPQARRRGRIYIGPLDQTAATGDRPSSGLLTAMAVQATNFSTEIDAITGDVQWAVWSPSDGQSVAIDNGWVDNAFDVQRRRGVAYTSRTTFLA